jgi:hypothetical protein
MSLQPAAWTAHANEMAKWAWERLVNRTDAWGGYRPPEEIGKEYVRPDGTKGKLGPQTTHKGNLTLARLARHFRGQSRADVIGLHSTSPANTSLWGALDIDQHGDDPARAEANRLAALHWHGELVRRGFRPLLTESNGKGGYHLRVLLAESIGAERVYHFFRRLTADHCKIGLPKPPEQFPKQADVRRCAKKLGNWLRVPGRHYKHAFWSRVWDGKRWLEGNDAIDFILSLTGDPASLVPNVPRAPAPPRRRHFHGGQPGNLSARITARLRRLPNLGEGQGRDDVAFRFAAWLVRDLALDDAIALDWLTLWDAGNRPPKGRERLAKIIENAHAYGQRPVGCGRSRDRISFVIRIRNG